MNNSKNLSMKSLQPSDQTEQDVIRWFDWPAMIIFTLLMLVVFAQFITRYVLNDSWAWTEEVARYLLMSLVFAGSLSVVARSEHISLEVVKRAVSPNNAYIMNVFSNCVSTLYYLFIGVAITFLAFETTQDLVSVALPKALIYAFIGLCLFGSAWFTLARLRPSNNKPPEAEQPQEPNHD